MGRTVENVQGVPAFSVSGVNMDLIKLIAAVQTIVKGRATEGSTWAGVGVIAATVGQLIGGPWGAVLIALGPLLGAVAVALPDKGAGPGQAQSAQAETSAPDGGGQ